METRLNIETATAPALTQGPLALTPHRFASIGGRPPVWKAVLDLSAKTAISIVALTSFLIAGERATLGISRAIRSRGRGLSSTAKTRSA
jgi:hypothetical protein